MLITVEIGTLLTQHSKLMQDRQAQLRIISLVGQNLTHLQWRPFALKQVWQRNHQDSLMFARKIKQTGPKRSKMDLRMKFTR